MNYCATTLKLLVTRMQLATATLPKLYVSLLQEWMSYDRSC